jgi:peptidylprolyl isomerase/peptidyl-prolyl cis-trans isomerase B (cyclophilin B)
VRVIAVALTTCALFLAAGLAGSADPAAAQTPKAADPAAPAKPAAKPAEPKKGKSVKQTAVITMEKGGEIVIEFYPADAPKTVENFVKLANKGFYNGVKFHRREEGFVIQGGDPKGDGTGGPGYTIPAEFNKQKHVRGAVAMARTSDPNSAGSQFYICLAPASFLDGQYTVFGIVTKGMDVVDKVKVGDKMKTVKIVEVAQ